MHDQTLIKFSSNREVGRAKVLSAPLELILHSVVPAVSVHYTSGCLKVRRNIYSFRIRHCFLSVAEDQTIWFSNCPCVGISTAYALEIAVQFGPNFFQFVQYAGGFWHIQPHNLLTVRIYSHFSKLEHSNPTIYDTRSWKIFAELRTTQWKPRSSIYLVLQLLLITDHRSVAVYLLLTTYYLQLTTYELQLTVQIQILKEANFIAP
jgi:hypothetical protein